MMRTTKINIYFLTVFILFAGSCKKYLDEKPDKKFVVPATIQDCQAMLDASNTFNTKDPAASFIISDNYYMLYSDYNSLTRESQKRQYIWAPDNLFESVSNDWDNSYKPVYVANVTLETLELIERNASNAAAWDNIKGQALFWRAKSFFQNVILWSVAYDKTTASSDLGIPLRLSSDFNIPSTRGTVEQTYSQVIQDLKQAADLLPAAPVHVIRPSKPAAYALLARMYLSMRNYEECGKYANLSLELKNNLMDYNGGAGVNPIAAAPFTRFNPEVILSTQTAVPPPIQNGYVDSTLFDSYVTGDLRKTLFFVSKTAKISLFKGNYEGASNYFSGIATDEVYLMRAECFARAQKVNEALLDLNKLLQARWKNDGSFVAFSSTDAKVVLDKILAERRKELNFRGLRWMDVKRLNKEGAGIVLKRILNTEPFVLAPNDLRYALALPESIITLSGMPQNYR